MLLHMPRVSLLVTDNVGLGKIVGARLLLSESLLRLCIHRVPVFTRLLAPTVAEGVVGEVRLRFKVVGWHGAKRLTTPWMGRSPPSDEFPTVVSQRLPAAFLAGRQDAADGLRRDGYALGEVGMIKALTRLPNMGRVSLTRGRFRSQERALFGRQPVTGIRSNSG